MARAALLALVATVWWWPPATAAPSSGETVTVLRCESGFVYSRAKRSCTLLASSGLADEELYVQGRALALAGHYRNALEVLAAVRGPRDTRVLTMQAFALRKQGQVEKGIETYKAALALDPRNLEAREYLGEAYAEIGKSDLARRELSEIEAICGSRECEAYQDLAEAIGGRH